MRADLRKVLIINFPGACSVWRKFQYNAARLPLLAARDSARDRFMNNQLEHLQNSIETLVNRYQTAVREKQALSKKISEMDAAWQKQRHDHRATVDGLQLAYSERMSRMERELSGQIEALQQENAVYRKLLEQSAADIRALLQRLPVPAAKEQVV